MNKKSITAMLMCVLFVLGFATTTLSKSKGMTYHSYNKEPSAYKVPKAPKNSSVYKAYKPYKAPKAYKAPSTYKPYKEPKLPK